MARTLDSTRETLAQFVRALHTITHQGAPGLMALQALHSAIAMMDEYLVAQGLLRADVDEATLTESDDLLFALAREMNPDDDTIPADRDEAVHKLVESIREMFEAPDEAEREIDLPLPQARTTGFGYGSHI